MPSEWMPIVRPLEEALMEHGVTPQGLGWSPHGSHTEARFEALLDVLPRGPKAPERPVLLDLGCGPGLLLDYLQYTDRLDEIEYRGIDISPLMIERGRERWPNMAFEVRDVLADPLPPGSVDVVIMNGLCTVRRDIARERFVKMAEELVVAAFRSARYGISFNTMNPLVTFARDEMFPWGFDELAAFLRRELTHHFAFRADYGLNDYVAYAWHRKRIRDDTGAEWWQRQ